MCWTVLLSPGGSFFKIPSGEITNYPYLKIIATLKKPVILSTGMCFEYEISEAIEVLLKNGLVRDQISILHCNTEYPTPMKDVNLKAMLSIKKRFGVKVGYSDHTLGIEVPVAAVALGAEIIEKHFTLDRSLPGPDHLASLEPVELKAMVSSIRNIEQAISGNGVKEPSESEKRNIQIVRKSLHFKFDFEAGHVLTFEDFISVRPGHGISPMKINEFVGKKLKSSVKAYMHAWIDEWVDGFMHTYLRTCIGSYAHTHIHTYIHAYIHAYIHIHTYIHTYMYACVHTYIQTYIHTNIHKHTHTHTHTHKHTYIYT